MPKVLFAYLTAFSATGGIECFNRALMKALHGLHGKALRVLSAYDAQAENFYLPATCFEGFGKRKIVFAFAFLRHCLAARTVLVGHINLAPLAWLALWLFPKTQFWLIAHGTEVWERQSGFKKYFLHRAHKVLAVSELTKERMCRANGLPPSKVLVFPNSFDPAFEFPKQFYMPEALLAAYGIPQGARVLLTVARLSFSDRYKGYDRVVEALPLLLAQFPDTYYLLVGHYDERERERIERLAAQKGVAAFVRFAGRVPSAQLTAHYLAAHVFAMPSKGEGFGIAYIEARACGLPVVAATADGAAEALQGEPLAALVDPDNMPELAHALGQMLALPPRSAADKKAQQNAVRQQFGFEQFCARLAALFPEN